ncbi:MAG: hypothetical protein HKN21_01180 [Candidatus Eisenbacteria bacterium]|uniref:Uncharacterized protein n=1 Tax=Eiseniibacteriota bacterium TaxID=2212470 RepID=A0A7Y2E8P8_UNCEI|nr:hypothetical protein [Candidatus Eisenbacteria bacterium]
MSYDLYFTGSTISHEQFQDYFRNRHFYQLGDNQAVYENEDTGVYFIFDYSEPEEESQSGLSLNLNYFRPHFFGMEAEPEVHNVVRHFKFQIDDPQNEGMGQGNYSSEGFLRGWNAGNAFAYQAMLRQEGSRGDVAFMSKKELQACWEWNFNKARVQSDLGDSIFVPRHFYMRVNGQVKSAAVWPDVIPALLPHVDVFLVARHMFAPKRFFFFKGEDICLVPRADAQNLLDPYETADYALPAYKLDFPTPPENFASFAKSLSPFADPLEGISMDRLLNQELADGVV